MSTKAEEVSIQALSPDSTLSAVLPETAGAAEVAAGSSAAREIKAIAEAARNTAVIKNNGALRTSVIALFPFPGSKRIVNFPEPGKIPPRPITRRSPSRLQGQTPRGFVETKM